MGKEIHEGDKDMVVETMADSVQRIVALIEGKFLDSFEIEFEVEGNKYKLTLNQGKGDDFLKQLYPEAATRLEYIICAAIWFKDGKKHEHQPKNVDSGFVVCGRRHHNCYMVASICLADSYSEAKGTGVQGFLTSKDRFVDRKEGAKVAIEMKQTKAPNDCLFSEDLY